MHKEDWLLQKTEPICIVEASVSLAGRRILDIGCGKGSFACLLSEYGARVTGVDPNLEALEVARNTVPAGTFHQAGAEAMPFADQYFDGAIFLNSLHHVPRNSMHRALQEAARVVKAMAPVVIIEPLAEGSLFSVLREVEDETDIRTAAQEAVDESLASGTFEKLNCVDYLRQDHFVNLDEFLTHILSVEPERTTIVEERRTKVETTFWRHAQAAANGRVSLDQPMRARVLAAKF